MRNRALFLQDMEATPAKTYLTEYGASFLIGMILKALYQTLRLMTKDSITMRASEQTGSRQVQTVYL